MTKVVNKIKAWLGKDVRHSYMKYLHKKLTGQRCFMF